MCNFEVKPTAADALKWVRVSSNPDGGEPTSDTVGTGQFAFVDSNAQVGFVDLVALLELVLELPSWFSLGFLPNWLVNL